MTQKVVIRVFSMNNAKSRTKAMKIAVSVPGVISVELKGDSKNEIELTGEGIDSTCLTILLRKKVGFTELVSVTPIPEKIVETQKKPDNNIPVCTPCQYGTPGICWAEVRDYNPELCAIM
ncbi:hypothetical protein IFM89_017446 [Coptis chinensis]|uniref:Uncharacterized protein n=1 Tax=Coptis chinensis TaxID=261450 RepID=A0A835I2W1_9MAGN|nr:hypothetical protein IFM89_017446 [Coptis chinensis]